MASYSTNEFRGGLKILIDGDPCVIVENEFVKPGKGQGLYKCKLKNMITGSVIVFTVLVIATQFPSASAAVRCVVCCRSFRSSRPVTRPGLCRKR